MAKVYMITEAEIKTLEDKMALIKAEKVEALDTHHHSRQELSDLYGRVHFDVFSWLSDIQR